MLKTIKSKVIEEGGGETGPFRIREVEFISSEKPTPDILNVTFNEWCECSHSPCGHWAAMPDVSSLKQVKKLIWVVNVRHFQVV